MNNSINVLIYILDDQPGELELIRRKFEESGISNCKLFSDGMKFSMEFNEHVHITIIDYLLGNSAMTGIDVLKEVVRVNPLCKNIIVSGMADRDIVIEFMRAGATDFVAKEKPNYLEELVQAVKRLLPYVEQVAQFKRKWLKNEPAI